MTRAIRIYVTFLTLALMSCSTDGELSSPVLGEAESDLSSTDSNCWRLPANVTLTGGGYVRTPEPYANHTAGRCWNSYLIDLNDYDGALLHGTFVGYAGAQPKNEAECSAAKVRGHVWQVNADKTVAYLGSFWDAGSWQTNHWGETKCVTPVANIEEEVAGYEAGGGRDYRIAFRAEGTNAPTAAAVLHTPEVPKPGVGAWSAKLDQMVAARTQFNNNANLMYRNRSGEVMQRVCRNARLDLVAKEVNAPSLIKAGASSTTIQQHRTAYRTAYDTLCAGVAPPAGVTPEVHVEAQLDEIYRTQDAIRDQIATTLEISSVEAFGAMGRSFLADVSRLLSRCNVDTGALLNYLHGVVMPVGTSIDRLLLGSCQGTPSDVGARLGIGLDQAGVSRANARAAFKQCMQVLEDQAHTDIGCNGPHGPISQDGTPTDDPAKPEKHFKCVQEGPKVVCDDSETRCTVSMSGVRTCNTTNTHTEYECKPGTGADCTQTQERTGQSCVHVEGGENCSEMVIPGGAREVKGVVGKVVDMAYNTAMLGLYLTETLIPELVLMPQHTDAIGSLGVGMVGTGGLIAGTGLLFPPIAPVVFPLGGGIAEGGVALNGLAAGMSMYNTIMPDSIKDPLEGWARDFIEEKRDQYCRTAPRAPMCGEQLCPAIDFAGNPGFFTTPSGLDGVRPLTTNDRLDHCLCALTDNGYNSGDFAASSKMCPTKEEKEKQDCLTNPFDEIDRPKPECVRYLYPTNIDMSAWYARMCERVRPNCDNDYITLDGRCGCNNDPLPAGDRTALCPNRNVTDCGPDATLDMKTCSCQSFDGGDVVWGGTGGCSVLPETFPGGIDRWQSTERVWADQMTLAGTPSTVLRAQAGGTTLVAPAVRMADFERDIGNALNVTMLAPDALLRSDFPGETNVHVTIPGLNLFNEFMGQVVHRNLTRDVPTTTAVSLSSRFRTAFQLARDNDLDVRLSFFANTSSRSPAAVALTGIEPSGALRSGFQRVRCEATPDLTPPVLGPTFLVPGIRPLPPNWEGVLLNRLRIE